MAAIHEQSFLRCLDTAPSKQDDLLLNGSQPLTHVAQTLMRERPLQFCECTLDLHNAASCGHSSAAAALKEFEPWCFMLAACKGMAQALLHSAFVCHSEGMAGDNESALCADNGDNACADAVYDLFEATHTSTGWENISVLLRDLHVPLEPPTGMADLYEGDPDGLITADRRVSGPNGGARLLGLPPWLGGSPPPDFGQLSGCMASVRVEEEQLHLPVSLSALSGNGSFTEYRQLFRSKCGTDYYQWMLAQASYYSGYEYASGQWRNGNRITALAVISSNLFIGAVALFLTARFVQRGHCYRLCSPSSEEERVGLQQADDHKISDDLTLRSSARHYDEVQPS